MAIDLWAVRTDRLLTEQEQQYLLTLLPEERRERLLRVRDQKQWREPLAAYGLLHLALHRTWGFQDIPPLTQNSMGKPSLATDPSIHFSLSHTDGAVVAAFSNEPVGVDIEKLRPVTRRVQMRLAAAGESEEAYFRQWVRYEAAVKRRGEGVSPHHRTVGPEEAQEVEMFSGYCAAVSGSGLVTLRYRGVLDDLLSMLKLK